MPSNPPLNDGVLDMMHDAGIKPTRENFIAVNWGNPPPSPWTPELEAEIPRELQDWSWWVPDEIGGDPDDDDDNDTSNTTG